MWQWCWCSSYVCLFKRQQMQAAGIPLRIIIEVTLIMRLPSDKQEENWTHDWRMYPIRVMLCSLRVLNEAPLHRPILQFVL